MTLPVLTLCRITTHEHMIPVKAVVVTTLISISLLTGCASTVRHTSVDYCSQPLDPAHVRMVISRTSGMMGAAATIRIFDNDQPIGDIGPGDKLCWDRYPGISVVRGELHGRRIPELILSTDTDASKTYYTRVGLTMNGPIMEHAEAPE